MIICYCINNLGAFGLGANIKSLLRNCSDSAKLKLHFFCAQLDKKIKHFITVLLRELDFKGDFQFTDFSPETIFKNYKSLLGDYTPYGRLLIPDFIPDGKVVYLDSDLVIETDILSLEDINLNGFIVGAVAGTTYKSSLEWNFFMNTLKLHPETVSLNSGVLVIDTGLWNAAGVRQKLLDIANIYPDELLAADQTLLNVYFGDNYFHLPSKFNIVWRAAEKPVVSRNAIFHFGGSPKPWDFFGKQLHSGYPKWSEYNPAGWKQNILQAFRLQQVKRSMAAYRSYLKLWLKIKGK